MQHNVNQNFDSENIHQISYSMLSASSQVKGNFSSGLGRGGKQPVAKVSKWLSRKRRALSCCACTAPHGQSMQNVYHAADETSGKSTPNYRRRDGN